MSDGSVSFAGLFPKISRRRLPMSKANRLLKISRKDCIQDPLESVASVLFLRFKAGALETGLGLNVDSAHCKEAGGINA